MTLEEFHEKNEGKYLALMVCQKDGSTFNSQVFKAGDMVNVTLKQGFALYKQMANGPNGDIRRWEIKDAVMTTNEMALMNKHYEDEHEKEIGDKPVQIKKHKK